MMTPEETLLWEAIEVINARLKRLEVINKDHPQDIDWRAEKNDNTTMEASHKKRHEELHDAFLELIADFHQYHKEKRPSNTSMKELCEWNYQQTIKPTEKKK